MNESSPQSKLVPFLVVVLIVASFLIGSLYTKVNMLEKGVATAKGAVAGAQAGANTPPVDPTPKPVDVEISKGLVTGNANAKVALLEFTDFQCPFCGRLFSDALAQIKKDYVDTGKVKLIVRDFPLVQIHPYAQKSAEASHCAEEQGKYWEYHDVLFQNQQALTMDDLKKYATNLGLNVLQFTSCVESGKYADRISQDTKDGENIGVRGTPASFVGVLSGTTVKNAVQISGAQPYSAFKVALDEALKK